MERQGLKKYTQNIVEHGVQSNSAHISLFRFSQAGLDIITELRFCYTDWNHAHGVSFQAHNEFDSLCPHKNENPVTSLLSTFYLLSCPSVKRIRAYSTACVTPAVSVPLPCARSGFPPPLP
jgi:hypothetical protein